MLPAVARMTGTHHQLFSVEIQSQELFAWAGLELGSLLISTS
jgi:hypothetical protein